MAGTASEHYESEEIHPQMIHEKPRQTELIGLRKILYFPLKTEEQVHERAEKLRKQNTTIRTLFDPSHKFRQAAFGNKNYGDAVGALYLPIVLTSAIAASAGYFTQ